MFVKYNVVESCKIRRQRGPLIWPLATTEFDTLIYHDARGHYPEFASLGGVKQAANGNGPDILAPMIRAVVQSRLLTNNYRAKSDPYSTSGFADDRLDVGLASLRNLEVLPLRPLSFLPSFLFLFFTLVKFSLAYANCARH